MNEKSFATGSIIAAFVASLCCLGPLLLGGVGLGAALIGTFAPLRPYFLGLSGVLLAAGFYFAYRKPKTSVSCDGEVCTPQSRTRRMAKPLLWLATVAVAALAFFPSYGAKLVGLSKAGALPAPVASQTAELRITGMTCEVCAGAVQRKLLETPGVLKAEVRYPAGLATVQFDPAKMDTERLISAVNETGYKATPFNSSSR